ncbi:hypothetical protein B296_00033394 [Ensete ventricosum]|uniref:Uncharacterized protein n=1 Tax=Ensete ventricosum TaxID=4639 RepID=A0A426YFP9_ENSVE|nr:hypothetical protein B296_00033394 [Ensete ventricosum]
MVCSPRTGLQGGHNSGKLQMKFPCASQQKSTTASIFWPTESMRATRFCAPTRISEENPIGEPLLGSGISTDVAVVSFEPSRGPTSSRLWTLRDRRSVQNRPWAQRQQSSSKKSSGSSGYKKSRTILQEEQKKWVEEYQVATEDGKKKTIGSRRRYHRADITVKMSHYQGMMVQSESNSSL